MNLPRSYYFRVMHQASRTTRLRPDYPLVFFGFFSRLALGMAMVGGVWQLWGNHLGISSLTLQVAFGLGILCIVIARFHAAETRPLYHVFTNFKSLLTWEILLLMLFLIILVINFFRDHLGLAAGGPSVVLSVLIILLAFLTTAVAGLIYKFYSHPIWNTNWFPLGAIISTMMLGVVTVYALSVLFFSHVSENELKLLLQGALLFLGAQGVTLAGFIQHMRRVCKTRNRPVIYSHAIFYLYLGIHFFFPLVIISLTLILQTILSNGLLLLLLLGVCGGVFLERILFFQMERPIFFLSVGEGLEKERPQTGVLS